MLLLLEKKKNRYKPFDIQLNTILIRRGSIRYDILSEPYKDPGTFDKNHILLDKVVSTVSLKSFTERLYKHQCQAHQF